MKNLFDYAPKELTQDGFIRWLLENYEDKDLKELVRNFVLFLTDKKVDCSNDSGFRFLKTWAQVNHMDVGCDFFYAGSDKISRYVLVIEDKTTSREHKQLETYNKVLKRWDPDNSRVIKVFYKTSPSDADEISRVNDANWRMFQLQEIVDFWKEYTSHPNVIVSAYADHIVKIGESANAVTMPANNDLVAWDSYMKKVLLPQLSKDVEDAEFDVRTARYGYVFLNVYPKGRCDGHTPYLEVRSRDILDGHFVARILKYEKDINEESLRILRQMISEKGNRLFKANWGGKRTQQAGTTAVKGSCLSSKTEGDLINSIESAARVYLEIVAAWDGR